LAEGHARRTAGSLTTLVDDENQNRLYNRITAPIKDNQFFENK
jgi:hypothetical protein